MSDISSKQFVSVKYVKNDKTTDFNYLISSPEYNNSLFIYNENAECYLSQNLEQGGGNAIIRPYRMDNCGSTNPRSLGIPTGSNGGFKKLTDTVYGIEVNDLVDISLNSIDDALKINKHIKKVYWSADEAGLLGIGIFDVGKEIKEHVTNSLKNIATKHGYKMIDSKDKEHNLTSEEHVKFKEVSFFS
jgi:hypothetical protein